jgi:hypothetical protein
LSKCQLALNRAPGDEKRGLVQLRRARAAWRTGTTRNWTCPLFFQSVPSSSSVSILKTVPDTFQRVAQTHSAKLMFQQDSRCRNVSGSRSDKRLKRSGATGSAWQSQWHRPRRNGCLLDLMSIMHRPMPTDYQNPRTLNVTGFIHRPHSSNRLPSPLIWSESLAEPIEVDPPDSTRF